jgi:autotransporter-associated beta strand protein
MFGRHQSAVRRSLAAIFGILPATFLCLATRSASAQIIPTPNALATISNLPLPAANTTGFAPSSMRFGPNGQLYAWDGTTIWEQTGSYNAGSFKAIGSITAPPSTTSPFDSDPGAINFSSDGQSIIVSEGAGGFDATLPAVDSNGLLFTIPITGGTTITPAGTVPNTFDFIPVPPKSTTTGSTTAAPQKYFVDIGTPGLNSEVDLFNASTGADMPIITGIPGASTSLAVTGTNSSNFTLYVGVGFGDQQGQIEAFNVHALFQALKSGTPLSWSAGTIVNPNDSGNNSGSGIFVDPRGYIFAGGPNGVEVIVGSGNAPYNYSIPYTADGGGFLSYVSVSYNSITNQFTTEGYDSTSSFPIPQTNVYSASQFGVAQGNLLNWTGTNMNGTTTNNSWDTSGNSSNWAANVPSGDSNYTASTYSDGDTVTFGDTNPISPSGALVPNVNHKVLVNIAAGGVQPAAVMFINSGAANGGVDYTITGGPIGGAATIELYGNGTVGGIVTLTSPNTFTGPVIVAAGVLNLQDAAALGNSSGVSVIAAASLELQQLTGGPLTFGLTAGGANSIPLNLYGTGLTANAGALNSVAGDNFYGGAVNVGSGGGQIVSSSTASGDQLTLSGGVNIAPGATLAVAGPGATTIAGPGLSFGNSSAILVNSGTLQFNFGTGATVSLGSGTTTTIAAGASLQLAGTVSALSDPTSGNRMNVVNQNSTASGGLMIVAGNQTVGTISGTATTSAGATTYSGNTTVAPGTSLTADQILQNTLSIGAGATVTIRPSGSGQGPGVRGQGSGEDSAPIVATVFDSSGDSDRDAMTATQAALATDTDANLAIERLENRVAILGNLAAENREFDGSLLTAENSLLSLESRIGLSDAESAVSFSSSDSGGLAGGPAAVPEPSTFVLLALAGLSSLLPMLCQQVYCKKLRGGL